MLALVLSLYIVFLANLARSSGNLKNKIQSQQTSQTSTNKILYSKTLELSVVVAVTMPLLFYISNQTK